MSIKKEITSSDKCMVCLGENPCIFGLLSDVFSLIFFSLFKFMTQEKCRPPGSEALPKGIVSKTSNLEMRPLWGPIETTKVSKIRAMIQ